MKLTALIATTLFILLEISALPGDTQFDLPVHVEGKMSDIYVLEVSSIPKDWLDSHLGAVFDDGFYVSLLVVAKKKRARDFAFQNFKELYVNGEDYFEISEEKTGYRTFPVTTVDNIEDYKTLDGRTELPVNYNKKLETRIVYVYLPGAKLQEITSLEIPVFLGWFRKGEKFNIDVPVLSPSDESTDKPSQDSELITHP